jgi:hypothetical protein
MKPEVRAELVKSWYRNSTFPLVSPDFLLERGLTTGALNCLPFMLEHGRFRLGFKPRELIRKIVVAIDLRYHDISEAGGPLENLKQILLLRDGAIVELRISHEFEVFGKQTLCNWQKFVRLVLLKVIRAGYTLVLSIARWGTLTYFQTHVECIHRDSG